MNVKSIVLLMIRIYQRYLSPLTPPSCRFQPTCSQYGVEAIQYHGVVKGGWMLIKRICKCHPFHKGGFDPVPLKEDNHS